MDRVAEKAAPPDELSHVPTHAADRDSESLDRDIAVQANREQMLEAIEDALVRIDDGSYGRCEECQGDIGKTRLDVLPFASRCVECEKKAGGDVSAEGTVLPQSVEPYGRRGPAPFRRMPCGDSPVRQDATTNAFPGEKGIMRTITRHELNERMANDGLTLARRRCWTRSIYRKSPLARCD